MSWKLEPLIDPQLGLSAPECRAVTRAAWNRWISDPMHVVLYGAGLVAALFAYLILPKLIEPLLGKHEWYHTLLWFGMYLVALLVLVLLFRRIGFAPCVYDELRSRGFDVCRRCGYLLTRLTEDCAECPECGTARNPLSPNDEDRRC